MPGGILQPQNDQFAREPARGPGAVASDVIGTGQGMTPKARWALAITSIAVFMVTLDNVVVTTAIPVLREDLHASLSGLQWAVNAYTLTFAVLLLTGAALGELARNRRGLDADHTVRRVHRPVRDLGRRHGVVLRTRRQRDLVLRASRTGRPRLRSQHVMIGAALVVVGAIAAFAIKRSPRTEPLAVADQAPFVTACACASGWCAPPGETSETEEHDVGAAPIPVLAGAS